MISYESYRYWKEIESGNLTIWDVRPAFRVLADAGHFNLSSCYGDSGMRNAVIRFHSRNGLRDPYPV
jgi:hypothetical protein